MGIKGLYPKDAEKYAVEECQKVVNSEVNGVQYLIENCDTKFWDVDLDEQGLKFTQFAYITYLENYETIVGHKYYTKKYNQEDFESVSKYLDKVYEEYLNNSQAESTIVRE